MSFWKSSLGEITGSQSDAFARQFVQIPDGTTALARIMEFKNAENQHGERFLEITWMLTDGDFKGQQVSHKIKVFGGGRFDNNPEKTRHRALNMLKLIYNLFNVKPAHANEPTDADLSVFTNKVAGIRIRETEPNDEGRQYNWVAEVHDAKGFKSETGTALVVEHKQVAKPNSDLDSAFSRNAGVPDIGDDDIPF